MKKSLIHAQNPVVANLNTPEVLQPGIGPFDFPTPSIAAQLALVFKAPLLAAAQVRGDQFCALLPKPFPQLIGVIAPIRNHAAQTLTGTTAPAAWNSHPC